MLYPFEHKWDHIYNRADTSCVIESKGKEGLDDDKGGEVVAYKSLERVRRSISE